MKKYYLLIKVLRTLPQNSSETVDSETKKMQELTDKRYGRYKGRYVSPENRQKVIDDVRSIENNNNNNNNNNRISKSNKPVGGYIRLII